MKMVQSGKLIPHEEKDDESRNAENFLFLLSLYPFLLLDDGLPLHPPVSPLSAAGGVACSIHLFIYVQYT